VHDGEKQQLHVDALVLSGVSIVPAVGDGTRRSPPTTLDGTGDVQFKKASLFFFFADCQSPIVVIRGERSMPIPAAPPLPRRCAACTRAEPSGRWRCRWRS